MSLSRSLLIVCTFASLALPIYTFAQRPSADEIVRRADPIQKTVAEPKKNARLTAGSSFTEGDALRLKDPWMLNEIGVKYAEDRRYEDAIRVMKAAIKIDPELAGLHVNISTVYESMGRLEDSLTSARRGAELAPDKARAYLQLCGVYYQLSKFGEAVSCYETLLKLAPNDPQSKAEMGASLIQLGKLDRALKLLRELIVKTPSFARAHNSIGYALFRKKDYSKAAVAFKKAVEIEPSSGLYRYNLAVSYALDGNKPGALAQYKALKKIAPDRAQMVYKVIFRDKLVYVDPEVAP